MRVAGEASSHDVFKLTDDSVGKVRGAAAKALGLLPNGGNYASIVATLLFDQSEDARAGAAEALGNMAECGAAFVDELNACASGDLSDKVRMAAQRALFNLGVGGLLAEAADAE